MMGDGFSKFSLSKWPWQCRKWGPANAFRVVHVQTWIAALCNEVGQVGLVFCIGTLSASYDGVVGYTVVPYICEGGPRQHS